MDIHVSMPFYSGGRIDSIGPINRFLPPVPEAAALAFLADHTAPGAWVLDPFGSSPRFVVEMARAGRRVLVTAGNPVGRFLLELAAHPPALADLRAALAELSAARKDGERLETHLQALYLTHCENCGRAIHAEAFLWESKTGSMTGKIYNCICGSGGEHPASPEDVEHAAIWSRTEALHRARALSRVTAHDDPDRAHAEEALNFYLPRAIYALGTLINRLDALTASDERRRCALALLLWALDSANSLWSQAGERPRPRQLTYPPVFRENNIWLALEAGVKALSRDDAMPSVPLTIWPDEPHDAGGVCIFEGPLRELVPELGETPLSVVVGVVPRPNQAFWTFSALWTGWLWGREAAGPFKAVLRRRRYDWGWQADALKSLFLNVRDVISTRTPVLYFLPEPEPGFLSAVMLAGQSAQMELSALILRGEQEHAQVLWKKVEKKQKTRLPLDVNFTRKAIREYLQKRGSPAPYLLVHAAALAAFAQKGMLPDGEGAVSALEKVIFEALLATEFTDLEKRASPETGAWGLSEWGETGLF